VVVWVGWVLWGGVWNRLVCLFVGVGGGGEIGGKGRYYFRMADKVVTVG